MQLAVDSGTPNAESTAWVRTQLANLYFNSGDLEQAELEYQLTLQNARIMCTPSPGWDESAPRRGIWRKPSKL